MLIKQTSIGMLTSGMLSSVWALGLGSLQVTSGLGQKFQARLNLTGADAAYLDAPCYRARIENSEGAIVAPVSIAVNDSGQGRHLLLGSRRDINEPTIKLIVEVACEVHLQRDYTVLLDPPVFPPYQIAKPVNLDKSQELTATDKKNQAEKKAQAKVATPKPPADNLAAPAPRVHAEPAKRADKPEAAPQKPLQVRDSLKLSDEVTIAQSGLKISNELGAPSRLDAAQLKVEQARLAAYLRDDALNTGSAAVTAVVTAPPKAAESDNQAPELLNIQRESELLRKQNQQKQQALDELRENTVSRTLVLGMLGFIFLGILLVIALVLYISRLNKKMKMGWWEEKSDPVESVEAKKDIAAIVDHVQASYADTNSLYKVEEKSPKSVSIKVDTPVRDTSQRSEPLQRNSVFKKNPYLPSLEDSNSSTFNFFASKTSSVKVEEISDVTQEAEFWMSVNDPQRAIEILEPQADLDIPDSPVPWLYLLDLYRIVADKIKYDALRDRFIAYFNANIPEFEADLSTVSARQLEDFPHLMEKIIGLWNGNEVLPFLESLLVDDRDGKRMGFELPVYRDILLLISVAHELERNRALEKQDRPLPRTDQNTAVNSDKSDDSLQFEMIEFEPIKTEKDL